VIPIVFHLTNAAAASTIRPLTGVGSGMSGDDLLLDPRQQQLRSARPRPRWAISERSPGVLISMRSALWPSPSAPVFTTVKIPTHASTQSQQTVPEIYPTWSLIPILSWS
jgi:hypothetical protein